MTSQECRFLTEQSITRVATIGYFLFSESTIYCEVSMPKIKVSDGRKVQSIIKDFKEFTVTPKDELYCPLCCCIVKHEK